MTISKVNIYQNRGEWCYSAWSGDDFDHSDTVDAETEDEARRKVHEAFPEASINRVNDSNE